MNKCAGPSSYAKGRLREHDLRALFWESSFSSPVGRLVGVLTLCMLFVAISPCNPFAKEHAYAATWPVPTSELSASVAFQETYSAGDKSYVHSGIDISASAGMQISSPLAGTVRFTGSVPSGDSRTGNASDHKTMLAVSIELQDGRVVTLMPFARVDVQAGESVAEGEVLGTLAQSGDISSAQPHLHMGLKHDGRYCDPLTLFGVTTDHPIEDQLSASVAPSADSSSLSDATAPALTIEEHAWDTRENISGSSVEETVPVARESFGTIESGAYDWQPRAERPLSLTVVAGELFEPLVAACADQAQSCLLALGSLSHNTGVPVYVLVPACTALALLSAATLLLVILHLIGPRFRVMWRNRKSSLSVQTGGDSMHKLFPASGTAFISRSRMSPREVTK